MTEAIEKEEHFINGGSSIGRRKKCRGSLRMELPFWKIKDDTEDSKLGTKIHKGGEQLIPEALANWNQDDPFETVDPLPEYSEDELTASQKYCLDILRLMGKKVPKVAWVSEQKFIIDPELQLGGTTDFAWGYIQSWSEFEAEHTQEFPELIAKLRSYGNLKKDLKVGHVWDYKNGTIPHFAPDSDQIAQYIVGLQSKLGSGSKRPFDVIFGHIYGPNFRNQQITRSTVAYTATEIDDILIEQVQIAEEALGLHGEDKLVLSAGEHCFFCKAKAVCKEFDRFTTSKAALVLDEFDSKQLAKKNGAFMPQTKAELAEVNFDSILATKTDEEIREFFLHIEFFQKAINAVKQYIISRHLQGKPIEGLRCVESTSRRMYKKSLTDLEIGEKAQAMGVEKPWIKVAINLTDMEKEIYKKLRAQKMPDGKKMPVDVAEAQAKAMMGELVDYTTPSLAIILDAENDPRPSIEVVNQKKAIEILDAVPVNKNNK